MRRVVVFLLLISLSCAAFCQGKITGKVLDSKTGHAVEYATVAVLKAKDSSLVTGTISQGNGAFSIPVQLGKYLVRISFMGYDTYYHPTAVTLTEAHPVQNVGKIQIHPAAVMMDEVVVSAERTMVEYQLDKRVVNVDKNIVTGGGTATEVLEQVPSVSIDNDGNVSLRGSSNVKVLINGRPSELLGSDIATLLEQIPASSVENVEIITNPSAKYDPEGMSGIINIKLKDKNTGALGLNGVANINFGSPVQQFIPTAMGTLNLNYATEKYAITFSADGGQRARGMYGTTDIARKSNNVVTSHDSLYEHRVFPNRMASTKLGFEYNFNDKNSILISYQLRGGNRMKRGLLNAIDLMPGGLLDYEQADTTASRSLNHTLGFNYTKKFDRPEQQLTLDMTFSARRVNGTGWQQQLYSDAASNLTHYYLRLSEQHNHHENLNIQLNYTHPFGEGWKLETGYEGRMSFPDQDSRYRMVRYNAGVLDTTDDTYSSTHYDSQQQVHAVYATVGGKIIEGLSAQAGLRGEYSLVEGHDLNHPEMTPVYKAYPQLYPTVHLSYQFNEMHSAQMSYSRRVRRPHMWDLNPYMDVREGQQMSFGNPNLAPEFTNAFELSYNMALEKVNIYTSLYYRQTDSMMTRYGFVWDNASAAFYSPWMPYDSQYDGYWASTWQNLNKGRNYGVEFIIDYQVLKNWKVNLSVNVYESTIEGTALLGNQDKSALQASGKFNTYLLLPQDWTIQFSGQYFAPWLDLQTEMHSSMWFDLAVKKEVLQRRGTINFRVGDVFHTGGFGHTTHTSQLDRVVIGRRLGPTITLGFSYKINNGLKQQKPAGGEDESSDVIY